MIPWESQENHFAMNKNIVAGFVAIIVVLALFGTGAIASAAVGAPSNLAMNSVQNVKSTNDVTPTFSWQASAGATWYDVSIDGGEWLGIGNTQAYTLSTMADGWHTFLLRAHNNAGETSAFVSYTFEIDTTGPLVPAVTVGTAVAGVRTTFGVNATSEEGMGPLSCRYFIDSVEQGSITHTSYNTQTALIFAQPGTHTVYAYCIDGDSNASTGPKTTFVVAEGTGATDPSLVVAVGELFKPKCQNYEPKVGSCQSVYYFGKDGMAHAFPSEAVYQSWYGTSFSQVTEIETWQFNCLVIGENVLLRPGTSLVKFSTGSTVYAVEEGGVLHPFMTEAPAIATYGSRYDLLIVTMPASVAVDYTFGSPIWWTSESNKYATYGSFSSIDQNY
jgi:hypothetical protein